MEQVCEYSGDRITDLPADVIQRILVFLPIKDAAKTSILSRKWRHQWRGIPELVFDDGFAQIPEDLSASELNAMRKLIMSNIYNSLLVHDGRTITKFVLSIPGLPPCTDLNHIILYLSNKGIKELVLQLSTERYKVHSSLFSALHLETLDLGCCEITPPSWSVGFSKLTNLQLIDVTLPYDFFENFLPKCPMLEHMVVVCCHGLAGKLQIRAPYLKAFMFMGSKDVFINCSTLPLLFSLYPLDIGNPSTLSWFASPSTLCVRELQDSVLEEFLVPGDDNNAPTRHIDLLQKVEVLDMNHLVLDSWEMERSFVLAILRFSNLRRLTIKLETSQVHDDQPANDRVNSIQRVLGEENCPDFLQHLSELRIGDSLCGPFELDLVTFLLVTAPRLQLIHITPFHQLSSKKVIKFMNEVMKCRRVSKNAEVIYDWNDEEEED
ncbi:unnamed protein product [Linum tenue]|uniref:F-box domain-containing protein n=1 Tax=Linum tenue TaxID=586396 RepID=A0AAV0NJW8_9ROSI|nr:unnamed protein product [Linum tenue]